MLTTSCTIGQHDAREDDDRAPERDDHQRLPTGIGVMLHAPGRAHQPQRIERHEGEIEADQPAPEGGLAEPSSSVKPKALGNQ